MKMISKVNIVILIACLGLLVLSSCKSQKLYRQLEEFSRKQIVIPEGIPYIDSSGKCTLDYKSCPTLMVVYIDSIQCATCRMKSMFEYDEIINFSKDSISGFIPVFIFSPSKSHIAEVRRTLEILELNYPSLLDEAGLFSKANPHIPIDNRFHTFLLDRDRNVIIVGDPSRNPILWELYKTTIIELISNDGILLN